MTKDIISHLKQDCQTGEWTIQTNEAHSKGVAELAKSFASEFDMGDWGYVMGLLHDKGKERDSFQRYIRKVSGYDPSVSYHGEDKNHAYVGSVLALSLFKSACPVLNYPIMGHHSGLDDYVEFEKKLKQGMPKEVTEPHERITLSLPDSIKKNIDNAENLHRDLHHIIRTLFSCLVDADFLDTEAFMDGEQSRARRKKTSLRELKPLLDMYLKNLANKSPVNAINTLRAQIQGYCLKASEQSSGFFSLLVPTGGGKTLSSLVWAINHAIKYDKRRIIVAIPYTSIATQTAQILGNIFGQENVLEHHSDTDVDKIQDKILKQKMRLATENWDYPIVVTTNVQLFESMMSNKPSDCRKLHNIVNSVLILDEVQTFPLECLQPIVDTLQTYQRVFGTSVLLTTASLPALEGNVKWGRGINSEFHGIPNIQEIIPSELKLHDKLRRVQIHFDETYTSHEDLAERLAKYPRVLCVVNSRKDAKQVFENLPNEGITLHLSRMMCSAHIRKVIQGIKEALKDEKVKIIRVVATQLIEAGVDIDFPIVFRQEAGLDSILQAAGRCNREGKYGVSDAYVFRFEKKPFGDIKQACYATEGLDKDSDWFEPETMTNYFIQRYSRCETFDKAQINDLLYKPNEWCFAEAAREFKLINDSGFTVYVNYGDEVIGLIESMKQNGLSYDLIKRLSQYCVNIYESDFKELLSKGLITEILEGYYFVPDREQYKETIGLVTDSHWLEEVLTI